MILCSFDVIIHLFLSTKTRKLSQVVTAGWGSRPKKHTQERQSLFETAVTREHYTNLRKGAIRKSTDFPVVTEG